MIGLITQSVLKDFFRRLSQEYGETGAVYLIGETSQVFSMEAIQQDPAEFRRKYKGLMQMYRSIVPGSIHRHTAV